MFHIIHQSAFYLHVFVGSMALVAFWLPVFAKKGSSSHIQYGRFFVKAMYAVSISGFIMTTLVLIDPLAVRQPDMSLPINALNKMALENRLFSGFLFMLSLLVFNCVQQSVGVLRAKSERSELKRLRYVSPLLLQIVSALIMAWYGFEYQQLLFQVFAGLCFINALGSLNYAYKKEIKQRQWVIEHVGAIFGAGIGAYTAFFVFGGSRLFKMLVPGDGQILLWVLPGVVGTIATVWVNKRVVKQFKVN
jgi:hypothetical protein